MRTRHGSRPGTRRRTSVVRSLLLVLVGTLALSACDFDVYKIPLPGGTDVGDDPMTVTAEFRDVLDLVPQSTVKVDEVDVGRITDIELDGFTARVTMLLRNDVDLPADTIATIRQTSLLGEKFVSLAPPEGDEDGGGELLADGDDIPLDRTGRNPEVEEVLGALSLVLNGGGIAQARTISRELNATLDGRESSVRSVLRELDDFVGQLDDQKQTIVTAIERINNLAVNIRRQQDSINAALDELPSALASLDRQRDDLVEMLDALQRLSDVGVRVINRTEASTTTALRQLQPVLTNLADSGDALVDSFNVLLTFPFVDEVVGRDPQVARDLRPGDYTNLSIQLDLNLDVVCTALSTVLSTLQQADPTMSLEDILATLEQVVDLPNLCQGVVDALAPCIADIGGILDGSGLQLDDCANLPLNIINGLCKGLPVLQVLPVLCQTAGGGGQTPAPTGRGLNSDDLLNGLRNPGGNGGLLGGGNGGGLLGGRGSGGNGSGGAGQQSAPPATGGLLGGLGGMPGLLNRSAPGAGTTATATSTKPTLGSMMIDYDPALVSLLTPGMVLR